MGEEGRGAEWGGLGWEKRGKEGRRGELGCSEVEDLREEQANMDPTHPHTTSTSTPRPPHHHIHHPDNNPTFAGEGPISRGVTSCRGRVSLFAGLKIRRRALNLLHKVTEQACRKSSMNPCGRPQASPCRVSVLRGRGLGTAVWSACWLPYVSCVGWPCKLGYQTCL